MTGIDIFKYEEREVRVAKDDHGEPWFVAKDVCEILTIGDTRRAVERLDEDEWSLTPVIDSMGREQDTYTVNESGLYNLILRSDKTEAKRFRKWVTSEVLPTIRRHGAYMTPETIEKVLTDPDTIIQLATRLKEERLARLNLEAEKVKMLPKVESFDKFMDGKNNKTVGTVAKELGTGQKRFFKILREDEYLRGNNIPYQRWIEQGLFVVKEKPITMGEINYNHSQTYITPKGIDYFSKKYGRKLEVA